MKIYIIVFSFIISLGIHAQYSLFGMKEHFSENIFYVEFLMRQREYEKVEQITEWMQKQDVERFQKGPFARDLKTKNEQLYWEISSLKNGNNSVVKQIKDQIQEQPNTYYANVASYYLASFYFAKEDWQRTLYYYTLVNPIYFTNLEWTELTFNKAYAYYQLGDYAEATKMFDVIKAIRKTSYYAYSIYYQSLIYYRQNQFREALNGFLQIKDIPLYNNIVPVYLVHLYTMLHRTDSVFNYGITVPIHQIDTMLKPLWKNIIGHAAFSLKKYDYATLYYKDNFYQPYKGNDRIFAYELSYSYLATQRVDSSIQILQSLSTIRDSIGVESLYLLANIYIQINQKEKAKQILGNVANYLSDTTKRKFANYTFAKLLLNLGYQNEAIMALEKIVAQPNNPYNEEAKDLLAQAITLTADYKKAYFLLLSIKRPSKSLQKMVSDIKYGFAMQLLREKEYSTADSLLQNSELSQSLNPYQAYTFFWEADIAAYYKKFNEAIFYYNKYLQKGAPTYGEANTINALYGLGFAHMKKQEYYKAIGYFNAVIRLPVLPTSPNIEKQSYLNLADCYLMTKQYDSAQIVYKTISNQAIIDPDYAYYKLTQIIGINNPDLKERMLADFETLYPNSYYKEKAKYEQVQALMTQFKFNPAIVLIKNILQNGMLATHEDELYAQLGLCYYSLNQIDSATQIYIDLIKKYPNSDYSNEAITNLKTIFVQENRVSEYIDLLHQLNINIGEREKDSLLFAATQIDVPNEKRIRLLENYLHTYPQGINAPKANMILGEIKEEEKHPEEAIKNYAAVIDQQSNAFTEIALYRYARILFFSLKQYDSAAVYYTRLLVTSSSPDIKKESLRALLRCYYYTKQWDSACNAGNQLQQYESGLSQDDNSLIAYVNGKAYMQQNDFVRATHYYKLVGPNSIYFQDASYDLINCYYQTKSYDSAQNQALNFVKSEYANDPYIITKVYLLIGDIFKAQGDDFNARATYESIVERAQDSTLKEDAQERLILLSATRTQTVIQKPTPEKKIKGKKPL